MNNKSVFAALTLTCAGLASTAAWLKIRPADGRPYSSAGQAGAREHEQFTRGGSGAQTGDAPKWTFDWASVETNDYRAYIANLRAIKCPEPTIRDIIIADINKYYEPKEAPFKEAPNARPMPWEKQPNETEKQRRERLLADYERRKQLRTIEVEKAGVIKTLLGIDIPLDPLRGWHSRNYERFESAIASVPPEKREQVRAIQEAYWELSDALTDERTDKLKGARTAAYIEKYKENNTKRLAALGQILTPQELETYEMRCSNVADKMNGELGDFKPTEDEFREIWRVRHDIEEPYGGTLAASRADDYKADPQKETSVDAKLKDQLGDDRFQAYKKSMDPALQSLTQLRDRFNPSQDTINQAHDLIKQDPSVMMTSAPRAVVKDGQTIQPDPPSEPTDSLNKLKQILGDKAYMIATANTLWSPDNNNGARFKTGAAVRGVSVPAPSIPAPASPDGNP